ncbi:uracil phosphoribosyltransferase [Prochlorococcus marinus]|nr:uracil phosphoribosyltransferase [Prochlorococcus marinus]
MTLRVVIPPHPLISHWLSILRIESTPPPIYAAGLAQIGKWLSYEAIRDWIPYKKEKIITKRGQTEGLLVDQAIPIYVLPNMPGGFELWQGARELIPNSTLCIGKIPNSIENTAGVILYWDQICTGKSLLANLKLVKEQGIQQVQIRVITAVASSQGLKDIGELFPELTIYAACIDPEITETNELVPGIGNPLERLNTRMTEQH